MYIIIIITLRSRLLTTAWIALSWQRMSSASPRPLHCFWPHVANSGGGGGRCGSSGSGGCSRW